MYTQRLPEWKRVAAVAGLATCLSVGAAKADAITLGPGNGDVTFVSHAGNLTLGMPVETGPAKFDGDTGQFTLGSAVYVLSNFNGTAFTSISGPSESFNYTGNDGDTLTGNITWASALGNDPNVITLVGTLSIASASGDLNFTSNFLGLSTSAQWSINGIGGGYTLSQFSALSSALVDDATSSGAIGLTVAPVPGPIVGAGIPGLLAALGSLVAFARRRKRSSPRAA